MNININNTFYRERVYMSIVKQRQARGANSNRTPATQAEQRWSVRSHLAIISLIAVLCMTCLAFSASASNTIWSNSVVPATAAFADSTPTELGVKFRSDVNGSITGIRFYKGSTNNG